jgi:predicted ester cyclase
VSDDIRELNRRFAQDIFNDHKFDLAAEVYFAPDFVEHDPFPGTPPTTDGFTMGMQIMVEAFPDFRFRIEDMLVEGDKATIRGRMFGTNTGPFQGMPPTGRPVEVESIDIVRVRDGRYVEHWGVIDMAAMMMQLGIMPPLQTAEG